MSVLVPSKTLDMVSPFVMPHSLSKAALQKAMPYALTQQMLDLRLKAFVHSPPNAGFGRGCTSRHSAESYSCNAMVCFSLYKPSLLFIHKFDFVQHSSIT